MKTLEAAQGKIDCDWIIKDVQFLDVFSSAWKQGDIAVVDGVIVGLEPGLKSKRVIQGRGKFLVPGFIDAHVHVESSLLNPENFQAAVLPRGTTTAICDPHEIANVMGVKGIHYFLEAAERLKMDLRVMLSSCVPATDMETNGGGHIGAEDLIPMRAHPKALGLAEMMNVPGVLNADRAVLEKLKAFAGKNIDGHAPMVRGQALSAYAAAGITSCHESSEFAEAAEKLSKGISVWIREGSVAKDLEALAPLLNLATSTSLGFCTDDRNPLDISSEGHIDHLIRGAIRKGVVPEVAYRAASWSVARHYALDRIPSGGGIRKGAIAPGYAADLVVLGDARSCAVEKVFICGVDVAEANISPQKNSERFSNTVRAKVPEASELEGPKGRVHVIGVQAGKILTDRHVLDSTDSQVAKLSVLERYGRGSKPANGYVLGFGKNFKGAIASSVGHDSHNLIVVGKNTNDMRVALAALIESGGGFCVVNGGKVAAQLELPFGGLMSGEEPKAIEKSLTELRKASRAVGCELSEPFLQLAFLSLPVIPSLKLTDKGLVDVDKFSIVDVRAS